MRDGGTTSEQQRVATAAAARPARAPLGSAADPAGSSGPQDRLRSPRDARRRGPARPVRRPRRFSGPGPPASRARSPPPPGARPGAGKPRAGARGPGPGEGEGDMARYLGPGDGEGLPLSRRGSSLRPAGVGALLAPRPEAFGPGRPLLGAAPLPARAGPPPSSRAAPRQGRGRGVAPLAGRPAPLTRSCPPGRPRSRGEGGKGASGGQRAATNAGSATRAAPLPQRRRRRRRRPGPCCCCQLVGRTLSMRARRPHPGNFRVWPSSPHPAPLPALLSFLSLPPPRTPRQRDGRVALRRRPRASAGGGELRIPAWSRARAECAAPKDLGSGCSVGVPLPQSTPTAPESSAC